MVCMISPPHSIMELIYSISWWLASFELINNGFTYARATQYIAKESNVLVICRMLRHVHSSRGMRPRLISTSWCHIWMIGSCLPPKEWALEALLEDDPLLTHSKQWVGFTLRHGQPDFGSPMHNHVHLMK